MTETNRTIHEAMGGCWHEIDTDEDTLVHNDKVKCRKCGKWVDYARGTLYYRPFNPSFTTSWADYGKALEWVKQQDFFGEFIEWLIKENELNTVPLENALIVVFDLLTCLECDGEHGAGLIVEFLEGRK